MGIVLDTSALIELERGDLTIRGSYPEEIEDVYVSALVVAELWIGVELAPGQELRDARLKKIRALLAETTVIPFTEDLASTYARVYAHLARSGTPLPSNDLAVAATAVHYGHKLVVGTRDEAHFRRVPGLEVELLGLK